LPKTDAHRIRRCALSSRMEVIEIYIRPAANSVCGSKMKKTATTHSETTTTTQRLSRAEMVELGILGLGLSLAATAGFMALVSSVS
jgi:hypothetical protein